ncbi:helix-turn-helix transcriptional regulator [Streptomyces sp. NBC_00151]|jgi:DNA-binding NarL/FixJ family response regulator|uniref:helix-turn-helix transcriptional regulator n=1 Tax=Streptomyces sp. NBC_00151 TaxID=2975669 RepID=UPI002DD935FA|nr:LuxR C-terminal-related transcriptional regulator [Streptomyces sp. NBC_00151]WRZ36740.1 LuxR C-terminal-related transcriptional regulator [Streptomyces sp. NBC_00151]WRZ44837.1 LuxR C-terminal-related transcriptional regulator [Streptomyces sp. NBC_00151]
MKRIGVAVSASDPLTLAGLREQVAGHQQFIPVPESRLSEADVFVLAADTVTHDVMALLRQVAASTTASTVLIVNRIDQAFLLGAVECRMAVLLPRPVAINEHVIKAIRVASSGGAMMPSETLGELLEQIKALQTEVLAPNGLNASGLTVREIDVLRLVAEGFDTVQIAEKLSYSERTIKNVIYAMTSRLKLRNRAHAVAYALRAGIL